MVELALSDRPDEYRMGFAGDTMNTAWYLRQLLSPTDRIDYLSAVGNDSASDKMLAFLESSGIGTASVARRPDLTVGLYMIELKDGERSFSYWRGQSAARTLAEDAGALADALKGADIAYFSGITIAILPEPDRQNLLDVLRRFRADGGSVVFDPNLRPGLWASTEQMTTAVMQAAAVSDTVLPSHEDEATWFGDADPQATADRYAAADCRTVIVKNGPGPVLAWVDGEVSELEPAEVTRVVDTTAAGDSFNAGYLAARIANSSIEESIRAGASLAAKVIQSRGALVSGII